MRRTLAILALCVLAAWSAAAWAAADGSLLLLLSQRRPTWTTTDVNWNSTTVTWND
jgi:hypothetical protein